MSSSPNTIKSNPKAFVCGWPISHSRSPLIHNYWIKLHGLHGSYEKIAVEPDQLGDFISRLEEKRYLGGNVTIPFKEKIFPFVQNFTPAAKSIGAINTLWFEGGKLCADNTDWLGFNANLDQQIPHWDKIETTDRTAMILGAGGAARAIVYSLLQRGFSKICIANRTLPTAEKMVADFSKDWPNILAAIGLGAANHQLSKTHLLINTTSLGMAGQSSLDLDLSLMPVTAIVTDIVYVPLRTKLLEQAEALNLKTVDGLGMLLHQAVPGFEKWFGVRPEVTPQLRRLIIEDLDAENSGKNK